MKTNRILILPWGNPWGWKEVEYIYENIKGLSKTTFPILHRALQPDRTIIIALDSLAKGGKTYAEIKKSAEEQIRKFLCQNVPEIPTKAVDVVISYSVGQFARSKFAFDRELSDFYPHILWELGRRIWDVAKDTKYNQEVEIYLDLTHGLNFMPTLVYRAVRKLGSILSLTKEVRLVVLNSEPFHEEGQKSTIHTVSDVKLKPHFLIRRIAEKEGDDGSKTVFLVKREKDGSDIPAKALGFPNITELDAFSASVQNGFPVGIYQFLPELNNFSNKIILTFKKYERSNKLSRTQVKASYKFGNKLANTVQVFFLAEVIYRKILEYGSPQNFRDDGIEWDNVKQLVNDIYKNKIGVSVIVGKEIEKVENIINAIKQNWGNISKKCSSQTWIPQLSKRSIKEIKNFIKKLEDYHCRCANDVKSNKDEEVFKRNFIAHSGLLHGTYLLRVESGKIYVKYCSNIAIIIIEQNTKKCLNVYSIPKLIQSTLEE